MQDNKSKELKCCKKDAILQAAEEVFIQKGYDGARMVEIANRAGVGHPLLHYHFSNKKMLFQQVVQQKLCILSQILWILLDEKKLDIREYIATMVSRHFDFVQQHGDHIRFIINELETHPKLFTNNRVLVLEQFKKTSGKLQEDLDKAAANGEICPIKAENLLMDILSLNVFSTYTKALINSLNEDLDEKSFLETRKAENIKMILGRLQPENNFNLE